MPDIETIVETYLEDKKLKAGRPDSEFKEMLQGLTLKEEIIEEILLLMDDEWTSDQLMREKMKRAKINMILGFCVGILAVLITLFSAFGLLFNGEIFIFFYGAIGAGLVTGIVSRRIISGIKHEMLMRRYKWRGWIKRCEN